MEPERPGLTCLHRDETSASPRRMTPFPLRSCAYCAAEMPYRGWSSQWYEDLTCGAFLHPETLQEPTSHRPRRKGCQTHLMRVGSCNHRTGVGHYVSRSFYIHIDKRSGCTLVPQAHTRHVVGIHIPYQLLDTRKRMHTSFEWLRDLHRSLRVNLYGSSGVT